MHRRRFVEVIVDFALICAAFLAAYLLRVEGEGTVTQRFIFTTALPILLVSRYLAFIPFGLYRGVWRYAGARDAVAVVAAVVTSEFVAFGVLAATRDLGDFPKSVFVIDALICIVLVGASRFWERAAARGLSSFHTTRRRTLHRRRGARRPQPAPRAARDAGRARRRASSTTTRGCGAGGCRACRSSAGPRTIARVLERTRPDIVLVTIPEAGRERLDAVVAACAAAGVTCRFVRRDLDLDPVVVLGSAAE